jgi:hypothetical protein
MIGPCLAGTADAQPPIRMSRIVKIKDETTRFKKGQQSSGPATAAAPLVSIGGAVSAELRQTIMRLIHPFDWARFFRAQAFRNRVFFRTVKPASRPA